MYRKKIINNPQTCVQDMLDGIKLAYPSLSVNSELGLTFLNMDRGNKVALLSGGGSGHEPFAAGFIANNMLTGAVSGLVFTSPPATQIFAAILHLSKLNRGGVLVAILNYTGDQLNFGIAIEKAKNKGIEVESITINDDCALQDRNIVTGNRGICGCSFVFKILGAMSEAGCSLKELVEEYNNINIRLSSMGACLYPCSLPNSDVPLFNLGSDEISLGCGVHGEAGADTVQMESIDAIVSKVLTSIWKTNVIKYGRNICVLVGNLGSSTPMECLIIAKVVAEQLKKRLKDVQIERLYVGTVMSSLDMKGFQISILNTTDYPTWLPCLDLQTEAFGWPGTDLSTPSKVAELEVTGLSEEPIERLSGMTLNSAGALLFKTCVVNACHALKTHKNRINQLDSECGDGDCGSTLESLADGILSGESGIAWNDVAQSFASLAKIAESQMGGTSGAVYSLLLQGAAKSAQSWHSALSASLTTLYKYSPARVGHRTLVDALAPASEAYCSIICQKGEQHWLEALKLAVEKAEEGCQSTLNMAPILGRASYAERSRLISVDAGAFGVTVWLKAIASTLENM